MNDKVATTIQKLIDDKKGVKLDLACGASKQGSDWIGLDINEFPGVDILHDLEQHPLPLPDGCCSLILASHILEHINPAKFGFVNLMNELWRISKVNAELIVAMPYGVSIGYVQDPTHVNPCNEHTWRYFDPVDPSNLFRFYKPKPWQICWDRFYATPEGNMEIVLIKREDKKEYYETK